MGLDNIVKNIELLIQMFVSLKILLKKFSRIKPHRKKKEYNWNLAQYYKYINNKSKIITYSNFNIKIKNAYALLLI